MRGQLEAFPIRPGSLSCPTCDQAHGKGQGGILYESRIHPGLLTCDWCGRYYEEPEGTVDQLRRVSAEELSRRSPA